MDEESLNPRRVAAAADASATETPNNKDRKEANTNDAAALIRQRKRRRRNMCLGITGGVILTVILVIVILSFTVFKAKRPVTNVDSVTLRDIKASLDANRLRVDLNITLDVDMSLKNPNKVSMKYTNSSALLNYRNQAIGEVPIPAGRIASDRTQAMNLTVTVMADRLFSDPQLIQDVSAGSLPINVYTKISGKVKIIGIIKVKFTATVSCDMTILISNRTIGQQNCRYKNKVKL
ncbi:hypothetical protein K2173_008201 [Erythroxylum novogranatense]|uniref:Late embryogenesis abundant protein LEA-2 subgroup domain-containing protein n=1 Tax=Erythroxylum novogranatense TaxID=1862640 RepID=A0AAV8UC31_9ROSI|nr:hypothetical protein K2173_008201 [Erythroxylum novogranatense]